jgi:hypothetical protein
MKHTGLGLIELFVVLMFAAGWGVLELVILRMERRRRENGMRGDESGGSAGDSRHAEGQ